MTALPDHSDFTPLQVSDGQSYAGMRPNVTEQFWGYAISPGEHVVDLGVLLRVALMLVGLGAALGALGVWLVPAMAFIGHAVLGKAALSAALASLALMIFARTALGTRVTLQVDTVNGELRETVRAVTGKDVVLATYGFDTIAGIETRSTGEHAQILLETRDGGLIPAGDGHQVMLPALVARLRGDLGLAGGEARMPDFAGPLVR